jgi:hypothetical protein
MVALDASRTACARNAHFAIRAVAVPDCASGFGYSIAVLDCTVTLL